MRSRSPLGSLVLVVLVGCGGEGTPPPKLTEPAGPTPSTSAAALPSALPSASPSVASGGKAPKAPVALEEYFKIQRMPAFSRSGLPLLSFSADESKVAYATDETGRIDIWVKSLSGKDKPVQVTHVEGFV